jgi:hypothetical protein
MVVADGTENGTGDEHVIDGAAKRLCRRTHRVERHPDHVEVAMPAPPSPQR